MKLPKINWSKKKQPARQPRLMEGQDEYIFRRSRTITGSVSSKVAAGAETKGQLKTGRLKLMELRGHRRQVVRLLLGVIFATCVLVFLLANFIVKPSVAIAQLGTKQPDTNEYQKTIDKYLGDHPFERFGFATQAAGVEADLKLNHSEISSIELVRDWYGGNIQFSLQFRKPLLSWRTAGQNFYVDGDGVAFKYNHFKEPAVAVTDKSGLPPTEAGIIASSRFVRFLGKTVEAVNKVGKGKVEKVIIPPSTREVNLKLKARNYIIRTQIDRDPKLLAEDIGFALTYFDKKGITPKYVDVRVDHKAFYKG